MKVTINKFDAVALWRWNLKPPTSRPSPGSGAGAQPAGEDGQAEDEDDDEDDDDDEEDDVCGICRVGYDGCCPDCKTPGDGCPLSKPPWWRRGGGVFPNPSPRPSGTHPNSDRAGQAESDRGVELTGFCFSLGRV